MNEAVVGVEVGVGVVVEADLLDQDSLVKELTILNPLNPTLRKDICEQGSQCT